MPGLQDPALLLDLWTHPLLAQKNRDVVRAISILQQPAQCVLSHRSGPVQQPQTILMVTLAAGSTTALPQLTNWRETMVITDRSAYIVVDVPRLEAVATQRCIRKPEVSISPIVWEGPLPSPGSSSKEERVTFRGHLQDHFDTLSTRLQMRRLRHCGLPPSATVGTSGLYSNRAAFIMQITDPRVIPSTQAWLEEALFISPRQLLMLPGGTQQEWEQLATELAISDPAHSIVDVRWRRSRNSGRPWIRPNVLQQDHRAAVARAQARHTGTGAEDPVAEATVLIAFTGPSLGGNPLALMQAAIIKAEGILKFPLTQAAAQRTLVAHEWAPVTSAMLAWIGQIRVHCGSPDAAAELHSRLNGAPVWLGASWSVLTVSNNTLLASAPASHQENGHSQPSGRAAGR